MLCTSVRVSLLLDLTLSGILPSKGDAPADVLAAKWCFEEGLLRSSDGTSGGLKVQLFLLVTLDDHTFRSTILSCRRLCGCCYGEVRCFDSAGACWRGHRRTMGTRGARERPRRFCFYLKLRHCFVEFTCFPFLLPNYLLWSIHALS